MIVQDNTADLEVQSKEATDYRVSTTNLFFLPIPKRLRYHPDRPFPFGLALNFLFAAASTATVANLYYAQPILSYLSETFDVGYDEISLAPTLTQAGYAVGILLISPLGDLVRRRSLVLLLIAGTVALSVGVATSQTLLQFEIINFFSALLTVSTNLVNMSQLHVKLICSCAQRSLVRTEFDIQLFC